MDLDRYKNDPVLFAEEVLGIKLYNYQKNILWKLYDAREKNMSLIINYPYRNGRNANDMVWNELKNGSKSIREENKK